MAAGSLIGALLAARRGSHRGCGCCVAAAAAFGLLEVTAALSPSIWLFAVLLVPIGMFGLTINTTANSTVQLATDPVMRGRVMSLYMMVFVGGTPLGGPVVGWITDTYGAAGRLRARRRGVRRGGADDRADPGQGRRAAAEARPAERASAREVGAAGGGRRPG